MISDDVTRLGFDEQRLASVGRAIDADVRAENYDGAVLYVSRAGETAAFGAFGYAERSSGRELQCDDVFLSFSIAKQLTVAVVLNRIERGQLSLTGRVADVIPEFGCLGKENITLFQLLTHTAGLTFGPPALSNLSDLGSLEAVVAATCASAVEGVPGESVYYSAVVAHAIMAEMVRRVEGCERSFREILAKDLVSPLGMNDSALGLRPDLARRMCPVVARDRRPGLFDPDLLESLPLLLDENSEVPGGAALITASDLDIFANMLRAGGASNGTRILSPAMIELATRNHTGDRPNGMWNYAIGMRGWPRFPASLCLGFFLRGEGVFPAMFGTMASPRTFGGLGAGSNMFWVDPERDLTCVFLSNGLIEETYNADRLQRISDMVLASVVD